jgi:glycerol-3-phosphate dehydrogenase (NAD(P)+)
MIVVGAGAWGTALSLVLARNHPTAVIYLYTHESRHAEAMRLARENRDYLPGYSLPENVMIIDDLASVSAKGSDLLLAVPSIAFRSVLLQIKSLFKLPRIAWATKGIDAATHQLLHEVVPAVLSQSVPMAVLSGPSFAAEVAAGQPTAISLAATCDDFARDLLAAFHSTSFRVYRNPDMIGLQVCGVLKNILAIATGIADGLSLGANTRAALVTRGLRELSVLCGALGARQETLLSLAGIGDVLLTCTDDQSRNRRFGRLIGSGLSVEVAKAKLQHAAVEGYYNTKQIRAIAHQRGLEMPIAEQVYRILFSELSPKAALESLLSRPPKSEFV